MGEVAAADEVSKACTMAKRPVGCKMVEDWWVLPRKADAKCSMRRKTVGDTPPVATRPNKRAKRVVNRNVAFAAAAVLLDDAVRGGGGGARSNNSNKASNKRGWSLSM